VAVVDVAEIVSFHFSIIHYCYYYSFIHDLFIYLFIWIFIVLRILWNTPEILFAPTTNRSPRCLARLGRLFLRS
jgi:hypothetical protein